MSSKSFKLAQALAFALIIPGGALSSNLTAGPAEDQISAFQKPKDVEVQVFASDEQLNNPVAICLDPKGRLFAAESLRQQAGVYGTAGGQKFWSIDDYTTTTLEQRRAMYVKWEHRIPAIDYTRLSERIRLLEDTDGDGRADKSTVFAEGFNDALDGAAAGVLERDGMIYFTCSPGLWMLKDEDGKGVDRQKLHDGFGVRVGIHGHDMHAPIWGPDGRLYFNVGDRGFHVELPDGKTLSAPHRGGVFRCDPDGSNLELFHHGVRNPQGMAFNEVGDLFTVDNSMGAGDKSRILYLVEDADSGWDAGFQLSRNFRDVLNRENHGIRPPWFSEGLYEGKSPDSPAWVNPASGHLTAGPSGMDYYPGIGLPERYQDHFFICDFRGGAANSGIHAFRLKIDGAGYVLERSEQFLWKILVTDCAFGFDGKLYVVDWISGWRGDERGRVYTVAGEDTKAIEASRKLAAEGFDKPKEQLAKLLEHPHYKIRLRAQFALAKKGAIKELKDAIQDTDNRLKRMHGIWGIGQIARQGNPKVLDDLPFEDADEEIRVQVAKVVGDAGYEPAAPKLLKLLQQDSSARIQSFVATAIGKLKYRPALEPLVEIIRKNTDADPVLRGACVRAIAAIKEQPPVQKWKADPSPAIRQMAVLVLRELRSPKLAQFLSDSDPAIILEAARAIHDLPIEGAMPILAKMADEYADGASNHSETLTQRVLNANFRIGSAECARRVAAAAANPKFPEVYRLEALSMLKQWKEPLVFDRILWTYRPHGNRDTEGVGVAVSPLLEKVISSGDNMTAPAILAAAETGAQLSNNDLLPKLQNPSEQEDIRLAALNVIARGNPEKLFLKPLLRDPSKVVNQRALEILAEIAPRDALDEVEKVLKENDVRRQQFGFSVLARIKGKAADQVLLRKLKNLKDHSPALHLDILEACEDRPTIASALRDVKKQFGDGPLGPYQATLEGGDAERGKYLFFNHNSQCMRCHKHGRYGGIVGPPLTGIGKKQDRKLLLESIIQPQAKITPGYGVTTVTLKDGTVIAGTLVKESNNELVIRAGDGKDQTIPRSSIKSQTPVASAMPPMSALLTKRELRDLIEFLATK